MYLCRIYTYPATYAMPTTICDNVISAIFTAEQQDIMTMVIRGVPPKYCLGGQSDVRTISERLSGKRCENAAFMPVMRKCGREYVCRTRVYRASIEKAFLSYALAEAMYDKNAC